jgi:DNA invertase Pin-like site-specific DNA recombinase
LFYSACAEFERDLIRLRTEARARGRAGGRRTSMTPTKPALALQPYDAQEHSLTETARTLGVSRASIYRHLQRTPAGTSFPPR